MTYGNEAIREHATAFLGGLRGGAVFTLMDVWVLDPSIWRELNTICWTPIDHEPAPGPIVGFFQNSGAVPVAMSRFGEQQLTDAGLDPLYCPHAVDCDVYKPVSSPRSKTKMPKDAFIVGMVAANKGNPSRKCFSEAFQAFKAFHDRHPEALLYLHTEGTGRLDGVNLPELMRAVGMDPESALFCDQYRVMHYPFSHETMAAVYSSLDVLLMPSVGEGFGLPAIEAQACGTPVIASDFSAQPELVGAGWTVSGHRFYTPLKAFQFHPDVEDITDALERSYGLSAGAKRDHAKKAREFAQGYHIDKVLEEHMLPALEEASGRFDERKPVELKAAA